MTSQRVISLTLAITLAVFLINMDQTTAQLPTDQIIKIKNKGPYLADLEVTYELPAENDVLYPVKQIGRVSWNTDYAFYVPGSVSLTEGKGVVFTTTIRHGPELFSVQVPASPICIHTWGTSINAQWSYINCSEF